MPSRSILFLILSILIVIFLGARFVYLSIFKKNYVAIFFNNGAIYFGELSTFPRLKLEKAIFPVIDENGNIISIQRFSEAFWQPEGPLYPNKNSILFIAPINKNSQIINLIEGKSLPQPLQQQTQQSLQQQATSTQQPQR